MSNANQWIVSAILAVLFLFALYVAYRAVINWGWVVIVVWAALFIFVWFLFKPSRREYGK